MCADTKLQISFGKDSLCFVSILANYIRNLHFRTTQRQINCGGHAEEKNNRNRNHDGDTSEHGQNSGNYTLQVFEVYNRICMIYQFGIPLILQILSLFEDGNKEPIGSFTLRPGPLSAHEGELSLFYEKLLYHFLVFFTFNRAR